MTDILPDMFDNIRGLTVLLITVMAVVLVLKTWVTTKSFVPTLGAVLLGSLAILMVSNENYKVLRGTIESDREIYHEGRRLLDGHRYGGPAGRGPIGVGRGGPRGDEEDEEVDARDEPDGDARTPPPGEPGPVAEGGPEDEPERSESDAGAGTPERRSLEE